MTIGSAAFLPGAEAAVLQRISESFPPSAVPSPRQAPLEPAKDEGEGDILYRIDPPPIPWPRVLPQL